MQRASLVPLARTEDWHTSVVVPAAIGTVGGVRGIARVCASAGARDRRCGAGVATLTGSLAVVDSAAAATGAVAVTVTVAGAVCC